MAVGLRVQAAKRTLGSGEEEAAMDHARIGRSKPRVRRTLNALCNTTFVVTLLVAFVWGCGSVDAPKPAPAAGSPDAEPTVTTVYVVRHAEKQSAEIGGRDPSLTEQGRRRAEALADMLGDDDVNAVFATEFKRTQETVAPLARALGVDVRTSEARDPEGLGARILDEFDGATVVVAAHSNTVPRILAALGVEEEIVLDESEYGDLFVVVVENGVVIDFTRHRFGD